MTSAFLLAARTTTGKLRSFTISGGTQFVARWKAIPNRSRVCEERKRHSELRRQRGASRSLAGVRNMERSFTVCAAQDDRHFVALKVIRNRRCSLAMSASLPQHQELSEREAFPQHECGLFGVFGHPNAAVLTYYGLFALQHRGQESAGIVTSNGGGR